MDEELDAQAATARVTETYREGMEALADTVSALTRSLHEKTDECDAAHLALDAALNLVESQAELLRLLTRGREMNLPSTGRSGELGPDEELADLRRQLAEARLREDARGPLLIDREDMDAIRMAQEWEPNPRADMLAAEMHVAQGDVERVLGGVGVWRDSAVRGGLKRILKTLDAALTRNDREAGA